MVVDGDVKGGISRNAWAWVCLDRHNPKVTPCHTESWRKSTGLDEPDRDTLQPPRLEFKLQRDCDGVGELFP